MPNPPINLKADAGNLCHKSLELLARKKLAEQNGQETFSEGETGGTWQVSSFGPEEAHEAAWNYVTKVKSPQWDWTTKEYRTCKGWMYDAIQMNGGKWSPLNRHVVEPELYFDIPIEAKWARYDYPMPDGTRLQGQLSLKGTVDLLVQEDPDTLTYIDWKSGLRKDWASGRQKDWKKLREDPQLRIYHYALHKLFPGVSHILMTIVFIRDGGAFTLDFGPDDIEKTERMIKERFEVIRECSRPPRINADPLHQWKCTRLCHQGTNNYVDEQGRDTGKTICDHIHTEIKSLGLDRVTAKYAKGSAFSHYGEGGGRSAPSPPSNEVSPP